MKHTESELKNSHQNQIKMKRAALRNIHLAKHCLPSNQMASEDLVGGAREPNYKTVWIVNQERRLKQRKKRYSAKHSLR